MSVSELLRWQWQGYARYHQSRSNLLLHLIVVPLFLLGNLALLWAAVRGSWLLAALAIAAMVVSVAAQGRGHAREPVPPEPFTSRSNAVSRILCEQWVTFPRFVVSGGWSDALRRTQAP
ncbi:MAG: Mpo1-like protein [Ramlibacter sp.]